MGNTPLHTYSQALYGAWLPARLADELGVSERTVRRWAAGEYEIPEGVIADLRSIAKARGDALFKIASR